MVNLVRKLFLFTHLIHKKCFKFLGGTKIALRVDSEDQLLDLDKRAKDLNVLSCVIRDAGQTQVAPGKNFLLC